MAKLEIFSGKSSKHNISVPISILILIIIILAIGWLLAFYILGNKSLPEFEFKKLPFFLGFEIANAVLVGGTAGYFVNKYLRKYILGEDKETFLKEAGIGNIYRNRLDAKSELLKCITKKGKIKNVYIAGISLRDFLTGAGGLREVWSELYKKLYDEAKKNVPDNERLKVHLLALDSRSGEGLFRHRVEENILGLDLPRDILVGLNEVSQAQRKIYSSQAKQYLYIRLYEHCPFAFIFATDKDIFIEQYYYRTHDSPSMDNDSPSGLPLIRYNYDTEQHTELFNSIKTVWDHSHEEFWRYKPYKEDLMKSHPETAAGIERAAIRHIFRKDQRESLSNRELECLLEIKDKLPMIDNADLQGYNAINILATSAKFYLANPEVRESLLAIANDGRIPINIAIANPVSQQAILRAIADSTYPAQMKDELKNWGWKRHRKSRLYRDIVNTIETLEDLRNHQEHAQKKYSLSFRLYSSSTSCAMLFTPYSVFVEQYFYGRSRKWEPGHVLGGEYPVFELGPFEHEEEDKGGHDHLFLGYSNQESQLAKVDSDAKEGAGRNDDHGHKEAVKSIETKQDVSGKENTTEWEVLKSHFDAIWESCSITIDEYKQKDEKEEFEANLKRLLVELRLDGEETDRQETNVNV